MPGRHRQGGKFTGSHTTVTDTTARVVDEAAKRIEVTKISLSKIESVRNAKRRLKFRPVPAGWEVVVYGNTSIQTIYLFTKEPLAVKKALEEISL